MSRITFAARLARTPAIGLLCGALLLGCGASEPEAPAASAQMRRLTETQYRNSIADIFGEDIEVAGRFEPDIRIDGLLEVGAGTVSVTPAGFEQYEAIARGIAAQVVAPERRETLVACAPDASDPEGLECARTFVTRVGNRIYRRPLAAREVDAGVSVAATAAQQLGDFYQGLAAALAGMLTSPDFLFRIERTVDGDGEGVRLDGWSRASRLSYFLWNTTPDSALLEAAARGDLDTAEGIETQVGRMLASPRLSAGVRAFFDDFLHLDGSSTLAKDALIYPAFSSASAADAREQTLRTIDELIVKRGQGYPELFRSRTLMMKRSLGPIYDVPVAADGWVRLDFAAGDPRGGLLTHASFLALHSHPGRTSPTLRGVAIREIFMCEKVPTPPANVNFAIVQDVSNTELKTTRARLEAHLSDPECASCHKLTDPIGLALEKFDGAGQYRPDENGVAIDTAAMLGERHFDGAMELGETLAQDPAVTGCLVKSLWHYARGQGELRGESALLGYFGQRFAEHGYRVPELMRVIATSEGMFRVHEELPTAHVADVGDEQREQGS